MENWRALSTSAHMNIKQRKIPSLFFFPRIFLRKPNTKGSFSCVWIKDLVGKNENKMEKLEDKMA